jgi:two-component system CheB/CheR fusion protein
MWELLYPDPDYRAKIFSIGKEINEKGKRIEDFYSTIRCKDGSVRTISWYATNIRDEKGEPAGSISIGVDVTEREKAQQAINNALSLLRQSNRELESYTYVVSHDLKAPLRTIRSFGTFLLEDYEDKLDETGKDYLHRMINASSHLNTMIEDLLVLSRVGRKFTELEKVDLNELLNEIQSDLEATIKEHKTKVVVDKLPVLSAQKVWMRQLFTNLISNALKFNESKTPKIEVLYEEKENDHLFKVRDNGIGIEKNYLERIFNLFERAPTDKKYDGTGAGLAICKKIVEQLGGKIWVKSKPGKGSTFIFTIPKELKQTEET